MTVYLVGAGPGDPDLLTVRAARLIAHADVIVHDRLAEPVLALCPAHTARIDVGKHRGDSKFQTDINQLLIELGQAGLDVVRLKGGDPFVFGRGGEEAIALSNAGVPWQVVPGISAAIAAASASSIPVTHRGVADSFTVVTGHRKEGHTTNWAALADAGGTIVVLMGVEARRDIARSLIEGGMAPSTPVAAIGNATLDDQRTIRMRLDELGDTPIHPPATLVIGAVAALDLVGTGSPPARRPGFETVALPCVRHLPLAWPRERERSGRC